MRLKLAAYLNSYLIRIDSDNKPYVINTVLEIPVILKIKLDMSKNTSFLLMILCLKPTEKFIL